MQAQMCILWHLLSACMASTSWHAHACSSVPSIYPPPNLSITSHIPALDVTGGCVTVLTRATDGTLSDMGLYMFLVLRVLRSWFKLTCST